MLFGILGGLKFTLAWMLWRAGVRWLSAAFVATGVTSVAVAVGYEPAKVASVACAIVCYAVVILSGQVTAIKRALHDE